MKKPVNLKSWLIPRLRRISLGWPAKSAARNKAKRWVEDGSYLNGKPKMRVMFECAECTRQSLTSLHKQEDTHMDHITPVVGVDSFIDWNTYIPALLCEENNYECLCVAHHKLKTTKENNGRAMQRRKDAIKPNTRNLTKLSKKKASKKKIK